MAKLEAGEEVFDFDGWTFGLGDPWDAIVGPWMSKFWRDQFKENPPTIDIEPPLGDGSPPTVEVLLPFGEEYSAIRVTLSALFMEFAEQCGTHNSREEALAVSQCLRDWAEAIETLAKPAEAAA